MPGNIEWSQAKLSIYNMGDNQINIKSVLHILMYAVNHECLYVDLK